MTKYIIRELDPIETTAFFDGDCYNENSGDYCNTLFIITNSRYERIDGYNIDEYKRIKETAENLIEAFSETDSNVNNYNELHREYTEIIHNVNRYLALKIWAEKADPDTIESIADFLTIATGKKWKCKSVCGYCQGDFCTVLYCSENYENPQMFGEIWLGCCKEFGVIELDEKGVENDATYDYIVADCQIKTDADYKKIVCEWAAIEPSETRLELIESTRTVTQYVYKTI